MLKDNYRSGFSLIEVAISLTIIGIMASFALPTFLKYRQYQQFQVTRERQEAILYSLSSYLMVTNQIPCPADPFAKNGTFGSARLMCTAPASKLVGIVPFRTLGIPETVAKDGFGHYFTYAIDREVRNETFDFDGPNYQNTFSEYYCTRQGGIGRDRLIVKSEYGESVFFDGDCERSDDFVVVVLVSHGPEGSGAYLKGGERIAGVNLSFDEQVNADSTLTFIDRPYSINRSNPFRHIVKWVSHKNLAGVYGRNACRVD